MHKWGHSDYLSPAYRRGYVEVLKVLENTLDEDVQKIPKDLMDFMERNKDPDYIFEVEDADKQVDEMSYEGFKVFQMIARYFGHTEEERQEYDQSLIDSMRNNLIKRQEYIQEKVDDYIKYRYRCKSDEMRSSNSHSVFRGIPPARLRECPKGCAQVLAVLKVLIPNYVERIPKTYIWVMEMVKRKEYRYVFRLTEEDGCLHEENPLSCEALEILADISYRFWRGYQVSPEEIPVDPELIEYE